MLYVRLTTYCPTWQVKFFKEKIIKIKKKIKIITRPVKMTFVLVHANYSLPKWQAVKLTFFAPCAH